MAAPMHRQAQGLLLLRREFEKLQKEPDSGFSAGLVDEDDYLNWEVIIIGPPDTFYEGGWFKAKLTFPPEYPQRPPKMKFVSKMWHPNISKDGDVCISILHEPGEDNWGYESAAERWKPVHSATSIIVSVISMISEGNDESPANVDAAVQWRRDYHGEYKRKVRETVRLSQEEL